MHRFAASPPLCPPARLAVSQSSCGRYARFDCVWIWPRDPKYHAEPGNDDMIAARIAEFLPASGVMPERVVVFTSAGNGITLPLRQVAWHMNSADVVTEFGRLEAAS